MKLKLLSLMLALCMLFSFTGVLAVSAEEEQYGKELITNGSFEELDDEGIPVGWKTSYGWEEDVLAVDHSMVYEGESSIFIHKTDDDNTKGLGCYTIINDIVPGATYSVTAYANFNVPQVKRGVRLNCEYYSADWEHIGKTLACNVTGNSNNRWQHIGGPVLPVAGSKYMIVYIDSYGPGPVYVDNISVTMAPPPSAYDFFNDNIFLYADHGQNRAEVTIDPYFQPDSEEFRATVDFELLKGDEVVTSQSGVTFNAETRKAEFFFDVSLLKKLYDKHTIKATVKSVDGEVLETYTEDCYLVERPSSLSPDGVFIDADGKPFYPVWSNDIFDFDIYKSMPEAGMNVGYIMEADAETILKRLDQLHALGMKGIVDLSIGGALTQVPPGHPEKLGWAMDLVEQIKDHPALLSYDMLDEPLGNLLPDSDTFRERCKYLEAGYLALRQIDNVHPFQTSDYYPANYKYDQKYCDILGPDIYYTGNHVKGFSDAIRAAQEATKGKKVIAGTVQAYISDASYGIPKISDVRSCVYRGFEEGFKLFGYYSAGFATGHVGDKRGPLTDTELWEPLKVFAENEQEELFKYFVTKDYQTFNKYDDGNIESFLYESWVNGNDIWMILHNRSIEEIQAKAPLTSNNGLVKINGAKAVPIGGTDKELNIEGNTIEVTMAPNEVYLYKITPNSTVDYSKVSVEVANPVNPLPGESETEVVAGTFSDIANYGWASSQIDELFKLGILNQTTVYTYSPATFVTRGDFAGFLAKTLNLKADATENFADVPADAPNAQEIATLKALGLIDGTGDNLFSPDAPITRQDLMKIAAKGMRYAKKLPATADRAVLASFSDKDTIAEYAIDDVAAMVGSGIIQGNEYGQINPWANTTRAEAAVIMHKILYAEVIAEEEPETPEEPEKVIEFEEEALTEEQIKERQNAAEMLKNLGIFEKSDYEAELTRAETAKILTNILVKDFKLANTETGFSDVPADNEYSGYIAAARNMGFMTGYEDGTFKPDEPVTYHQLIKILVKLLGYNIHAENLGGYPAGYLAYASKLDLTDGVGLGRDMAIRASAAVMLIKNALDEELALIYNYGGDKTLTVETDSDETLLTHYLGIDTYEGQITGTELQTITPAARPLKAGEVSMGATIFAAGRSGAEKLIGQKAVLYVKENPEKGTKDILYAEAAPVVSSITINSSSLVAGDGNRSKLYYNDEDGKERSVVINGDAEVLYNGRVLASWDIDDLYIDAGQLTLISSTGTSYDTIIIDEYENRQVDGISIMYNKIYFTDGTDISLDAVGKTITLVDADGISLTVDECDEGNIVSIYSSEDGKTLKLVLSRKTVKGIVSEHDDTSATIKDVTYPLSANVIANSGLYGSVQMKNSATYYLDANGSIAAIEQSNSDYMYGYLTGMSKEQGLSGGVLVRLFTSGGTMETFKLAENVDFNNVRVLPADVYSAVDEGGAPQFFEGGQLKQQLIGYNLNNASEVTLIKTYKDGRYMSEAERLEEFTLDAVAEGTSADDSFWLSFYNSTYNNESFGGYYRYDSSTVFFSVPSQVSDDKYYSIKKPKDGTHVVYAGLPMSFYDIDEDLMIGATVSISDSAAIGKPADQATPTLVRGITRATNEDGDQLLGIRTFTRDLLTLEYKEETLFVKSDAEVYVSNLSLSSEWTSSTRPQSILVTSLEPGDVIQYDLDENTGMIKSMHLLSRAQHKQLNKEAATGGISKHYPGDNSFTHIFGTVMKELSYAFIISNQFGIGRPILKNDSGNRPIMAYLVEADENGDYTKSSMISTEDIRVDDVVYACRTAGITRMFVVYR